MNGRGPIQQWSTYRGPFDAPELPVRIQGKFEDGRYILTSGVVRSEGRRVWTESGSEYELGEPDERFTTWLAKNDYQFDPEHPIRLVSKMTRLPPPEMGSESNGGDEGEKR